MLTDVGARSTMGEVPKKERGAQVYISSSCDWGHSCAPRSFRMWAPSALLTSTTFMHFPFHRRSTWFRGVPGTLSKAWCG